jgi:hypothetical protein
VHELFEGVCGYGDTVATAPFSSMVMGSWQMTVTMQYEW